MNGPNLNLLGTREPEIYGQATLADVEELVQHVAAEHDWESTAIQSNHEGVLIDAIHATRVDHQAIVINPGGLTHTSVSLRDALSATNLPIAEVHISNVHRREEFRHHSFIAGIAEFSVVGAGIAGYRFATERLIEIANSLSPD